MGHIYKFEVQEFNQEYEVNNLDLFSRGLYNLIENEFDYGKTFSALAIARYSTEKLSDIETSLNILCEFGFITKVE